jgi:hypothetical protein
MTPLLTLPSKEVHYESECGHSARGMFTHPGMFFRLFQRLHLTRDDLTASC